MTRRIFVYGTLKAGFPNAGRNTGRRIAGAFRTRLAYPFYVVRLPNEDRAPWLVDKVGHGQRVSGEVYEVDPDTLRAMDRFEEVGLPGGYERVELALESIADPARTLRVQAYMKREGQLVDCLAVEGPYAEYTPALAAGYRLDPV